LELHVLDTVALAALLAVTGCSGDVSALSGPGFRDGDAKADGSVAGPRLIPEACSRWMDLPGVDTIPEVPTNGMTSAFVSAGSSNSECHVVLADVHLYLRYGHPILGDFIDTAVYALTVCNRCDVDSTIEWLGDPAAERVESNDEALERFAFTPLGDTLRLAADVSTDGLPLSIVYEQGDRSRPVGAAAACGVAGTLPVLRSGESVQSVVLAPGEAFSFVRGLSESGVGVLVDAVNLGYGTLEREDFSDPDRGLDVRFQVPFVSNGFESIGSTYPFGPALDDAGLPRPSPCTATRQPIRIGSTTFEPGAPAGGLRQFVRLD